MATLSKLKELMSIPGAIAAGEFSDDGRLIAYHGNID
jgi:roadblock/LC7 domain-containing protein